MHDYQRVLGERVKAERKKRGLTQAQLGKLTHSNKRTILDIENYRGNPKLETLISILSFLEIDPYIIFFPGTPERSEALSLLEQQLHGCSEEQIRQLTYIYKAVLAFSDASEKVGAY